MPKGQSLQHRLWAKVEKHPDGCWVWTGAVNKRQNGYGIIYVGPPRRQGVVHVLVYEWLRGPIPDDFDLDHLCRNTRCVNPDHLEPVPHEVNCRRGRSAEREKTSCPKGHPYNEANTYIRSNGWRGCRLCRLASYHRWLERKEQEDAAYA